MKQKIVMMVLFSIFTLIGCSKSQTQLSEPQQIVENYFKYSNEKNKEEVLSTLTEWHNSPNVVLGIENLENIKLIDIKEEKSNTIRNGYLHNGRGSINNTTENNLKVYTVKYEVKYKKDSIVPQDSGIYDWCFFVVRKDENSPWLIDDMGV